MIRRSLMVMAVALLVCAWPAVAAEKFSVKVEDIPPPKELSDAIRSLFVSKAMTVYDEGGKAICTIWPRKEVEAKAITGPSYFDLEESTLIGAIRFPQTWSDYRKQKIRAGVYTLRLGIQPMDGDHMGTAPYNEFLLPAPADKDTKPDQLETEEFHELSMHSTTRRHPGLMLLFPNPKPADEPTIESKPQDHWVLSFKIPVTADGKKAPLGFSLVVAGHTSAE